MTNAPLSILHVLAPADAGGLETVVRSLVAGHTAQGHTVEIAAVLDTPSNAFVDEARDAGITVHVIHSPARSVQPERAGVRALLAQRSVDVMHSHGYRSDILNLGIARRMHVPSVTTLHGFASTDRKSRVYEWLQLRGIRRASAVIAVSTNVADRVIASGVRRQAVQLIRNAVTTVEAALDRTAARAQLGLGDGLQLGWIGRISPEKGPDVMIEAMAQLGDLPATLSFVGEGPTRASISERADRLGVADRVKFHGRVPNAATLLRAFDVVVLSSRTEGTPMVLLEAMDAGVPIVTTRVGGVPDMLNDDEALLVNPEDPRALVEAIRTALADPAASATRAARARARIDAEFSNKAWLERHIALYRSIQPGRGDGWR